MKTVAFIITTTELRQPETKLLNLILTLKQDSLLNIKVLCLFDSSVKELFQSKGVDTYVVNGLGGLVRHIQTHKFDIIHTYGSRRVLEVLIKNIPKNIQLFQHVFDYDKNNDFNDLNSLYNINTIIDNEILKSYYPNSITLFHGVQTQATSTSTQIQTNQTINSSLQNKQSSVLYKPREIPNVNFIIQLAKSLKQHNFNIKITISYNGPLKQYLIQKISEEDVCENLEVTSDLEIEDSNAQVYLDIDEANDLSLNTLIALHNNIPIVISQTATTQELMKNKSLGYLIRSLEPDFVARLVFAALQIPKNEVSIPQQYTSEDLANKIKDFYKLQPDQNIAQPTMQITNQSSNTDYIIVPYGICGGGEIFLKNHIEQGTFTNPHLLFLARNPLIDLMGDKCSRSLFSSFAELGNFLIKRKAKKVFFYNSASVYNLLCRVRNNLPIQINEIVHSTLKWGDSMHGVNRNHVNHTHCVSDSVAKEWGIKNYKLMRVVIDETRFKIPKVEHDGIVIGTVARISAEKNLRKVVDIAKHAPNNYKFIIVGKDGGAKNDLLNYITTNNLQHKVIVKEFREDIEKEYAQFDVFLLTSHVEGTPITILEAQAANLPVIAPMVGGIREMMRGKQGYVYAPTIDDRLLLKQIEMVLERKKQSKQETTIIKTNNPPTPSKNKELEQKDIQLHQIFYKTDQLKHIKNAQPYNNSNDPSGQCEYGVFMREFKNIQASQAKYIGYISWKFTEKTKKNPQDFLDFIKNNPGHDVYAMQPFNYHLFPHGVWDQGTKHHPGIVEITQWAISELNLNKDIIHFNLDISKLITCNYWAATKEFWKKYEEFTLPIAQFLIDKANKDKDLHTKLFVRTSNNPALWGAIFPYIMERLVVSLLMLNPSIKVKIWHTNNNTITGN